MNVLKLNFSVEIDVTYYEKRTNKTDEQIAKEVFEFLTPERNTLATEAKIAAIAILDGEKP